MVGFRGDWVQKLNFANTGDRFLCAGGGGGGGGLVVMRWGYYLFLCLLGS